MHDEARIPTGKVLEVADITATDFSAATRRSHLPWLSPATSTRQRTFDTDDIAVLCVFGLLTAGPFSASVAGAICSALRTGMRKEPGQPVMRICPDRDGTFIVTPRDEGRAVVMRIDVRQLRRRVRHLLVEGLEAEQDRLDAAYPDPAP